MSTTVTIEDNNGQVVIVEEQSVVSQRLAVEELEPQTRVVETNVIDEAIVAESPLVNNNQQLYLLVSPLFDVKVAFNVVDGHLIVTYYDLLSKDLGNVVGPQGPAGTDGVNSLNYKKIYTSDTAPNLSTTYYVGATNFSRTAILGDIFNLVYKDTTTGYVYLCVCEIINPASYGFRIINFVRVSGENGATGKSALVCDKTISLASFDPTQDPQLISYSINYSHFNRTPELNDDFVCYILNRATNIVYVAQAEVQTKNIANTYVNTFVVSQIVRVTGQDGAQGVAGPTALSYGTNMTVTSSTQPDINTQNTFYVNQFNRTPEVNDTFYVAIKNTETLKDYVAYYRVNFVYPYTCTATCYQITLTSSAQPINQFRGEIQESDWTQQGNTYFYTIPRSEHNLINPRVVEYLVESEEDNEQALENAFYSYVVKLSGNIKFISDLPVNVSYMLIGD